MTVALAPVNAPTDANIGAFQDGYTQTLVSAQTVTATDTTANFTLPYIGAAAKAKMVVVITGAPAGTSPTLQVDFFESVDGGTTFNGTAALTSGAGLNAAGATWSAAATAPMYNQGHLKFTVGGTGGPSFVVSVYIVVWNR